MPSYYFYDYNHTFDFSEGSHLRQDVLKNKTIYVHMQTHFKNRLSAKEKSESFRFNQLKTLMPSLSNYVQTDYYFNSSLPLFDY